jgi:hypothetical protein
LNKDELARLTAEQANNAGKEDGEAQHKTQRYGTRRTDVESGDAI